MPDATSGSSELYYETGEDPFDHSIQPEGRNRHFAAMPADGDRTAELATLDVPTLAIQGGADPLVDVSGAKPRRRRSRTPRRRSSRPWATTSRPPCGRRSAI